MITAEEFRPFVGDIADDVTIVAVPVEHILLADGRKIARADLIFVAGNDQGVRWTIRKV